MKKLLLLICLAVFVGCDDAEPPIVPIDGIDIEALAADPEFEFVYFESGDDQYYFLEERVAPGFSNRYIQDQTDSHTLDQINILMTNNAPDPTDYHCDMFISGSKLQTQSFPFVINSGSALNGILAEIQLKDRNNPVTNQFGPEDRFNLVSTSGLDDFRMVVQSFNNNVIEATFTGTMTTRATSGNKEMVIKNGRLRIKLEVD